MGPEDSGRAPVAGIGRRAPRQRVPVRIALAVAALGGLVALGGCGHPAGVRGSGTIELDEIDVSSLVGGRVARLAVDEGDTVRAGDTLAVLDRGEVTAALAAHAAEAERATAQYHDVAAGPRTPEVIAAGAALAEANAQLAVAEAQYQRMASLVAGHVVAESDFDQAKATRDAAAARAQAAGENVRLLEQGYRRNQVAAAAHAAQSARAELAGSASRASELVLTAPISGVVLLRNFLAGEIVNPGQPVVTLGDPDRLWIRVYVAAPELPRVRLGAPVTVRVPGASRTFPGHVIEIATSAEFTPRAALTEDERANLVFGVKVRLDPTGGALKPGLPADAVIADSGARP